MNKFGKIVQPRYVVCSLPRGFDLQFLAIGYGSYAVLLLELFTQIGRGESYGGGNGRDIHFRMFAEHFQGFGQPERVDILWE